MAGIRHAGDMNSFSIIFCFDDSNAGQGFVTDWTEPLVPL